MVKNIEAGIYTQLNTNTVDYLIQNQSNYDLNIVIGTGPIAANTGADFVLSYKDGIAGSMINGICWGKPAGKTNVNVGIVEA